MAPRILIYGTIMWAQEELKQLFDGIAEVIFFSSPDRATFFKDLGPNGKYSDIVGLFRDSSVIAKTGDFDKELIDALPSSLKWVASNGAGYDNVDVAYLKEKGIFLSNTPSAVDDATATTALYLMISCMRQYSVAERSLRQLAWKPKGLAPLSHDLTGKTLAILGLGGIGLRIAQLARAFPMRIMLGEADVVSVSVPLNPNTVGLVGEKYIRAMKKGSIIVNTARGKVIDEDAMIRALEDGHLGSVGLDVFPNEPEVNPRLLEFPHITLLPHMGTENQDTQKVMEIRALTNLVDYLKTGVGKDLVPEMQAK
ncbi:2-hydroxyacid dehydrogenase [Mucidula mucida]|nr:2-hydroxyacid dehydrogenase [Mucidula mucida]